MKNCQTCQAEITDGVYWDNQGLCADCFAADEERYAIWDMVVEPADMCCMGRRDML